MRRKKGHKKQWLQKPRPALQRGAVEQVGLGLNSLGLELVRELGQVHWFLYVSASLFLKVVMPYRLIPQMKCH